MFRVHSPSTKDMQLTAVGPLWILALILGAGLAASVVTILPVAAKFALIFVILVPVVVLPVRRALRWRGARSVESPTLESRTGQVRRPAVAADSWVVAAEGEFRLARFFYYLGLLLVGQLAFRPAVGFTLSDWLFLFALFVTCFQMLAQRRSVPFRLPSLLVIGIALFSIGALVASFGAAAPLESFVVLAKFVYLSIVWFWLGTVLLKTERHVMVAVALWIVSAAANGFATIVQFFWGNIIPGTVVDGTRLAGFTDHVNDLGGLAGIAFVPAIMYATRKSGSLWQSLLGLALLGLTAAGLVLSSSISGFMAATVGFCVWVISGRVQFRLVILLVLAGLVGYLLMDAQQDAGARSPLERLTTSINRSNDEEATFWSRVITFDAAWQVIKDNPFTGVGLDSQSQVTRTGYQVHNVVLGAWFEAGALGALGILITMIAVVWLAMSTVAHARTKEEWTLSLALLAAVLAFMVFAMSAPVLYKRIVWIGVALMTALRMQQVRSGQEVLETRELQSQIERQAVSQTLQTTNLRG